MSLVKYRLREVAQDFGVTPKEITQILENMLRSPSPTPRSSRQRN